MKPRAAKFIFFTLLLCLPCLAQIAQEDFQRHLQETADKVEEFKFLAKTAQKHGLKLWLFGGSASSLAHYVKENMLLEEGSDEYYSESFAETSDGKRDFTDIFRPTQDIDLVVDGEMASVADFEREVLQHLPDIKGNKQTWEVRTLREDYGEKLALLNNPNFFNQHTDSHSVGMISLSEVDEDKVVRDLLDWEAENPRFLQDVLANKLHYYYSDHHSETLRFQQGKNPPIISVVRYFIKLFQHELEMSSEDLKKLQKIIADFNPQEVGDSYTERWLQHNAPKLFLHSRNVEYSWDMLEKIGLRAKLLQVGDINKAKSPAWWANKGPLRSFELGGGKGKTAQELGIKTVAHDTSDFFLWTVITRSRKGEANVFESRADAVGENAFHGRGFYTMKNSKRGLYRNGFSISFHMHPKAREGVDFKVAGDMILVLNRNAIRVIPESLDVGGLLDYLHLAKEGNGENLALLEKVRRRLDFKYTQKAELAKTQQEITQALKFLKEEDDLDLWRGWFALKLSTKYPKAIEEMMNTTNLQVLQYFAKKILPQRHWGHPKLIDKTIATAIKLKDPLTLRWLARYTFSKPYTKGMAKSINKTISAAVQLQDFPTLRWLAEYTFSGPHTKEMTKSIEKTIAAAIRLEDFQTLRNLAYYTFSKPHTKGMTDLIDKTINAAIQGEDPTTLQRLARYTFSKPHTKEMTDLIDKTIVAAIQLENPNILINLAYYTFFQPHAKGMADLIDKTIDAAIKLNSPKTLSTLAIYTFSRPHTKEMTDLIDKTIAAAIRLEKTQILQYLTKYTFSKPHAKGMIDSIEKTIAAAIQLEDTNTLEWLAVNTFSKPHAKGMADLIDKTIDTAIQLRHPKTLLWLARYTFSEPHAKGMAHLIEKTIVEAIEINTPRILQVLAQYTLSQPHWQDHPELVELLIQNGDRETLKAVKKYVLIQPHWENHPRLLELSRRGKVTLRKLIKGLKNEAQGC